ncbi:epimerase [Phaeobacter sp. PT47_59]|uniref:epimerase n=1 Tax=Phaeobacter sp. PT47_59 TaxID=3029979 RepID=UPI0023803975|nr:epimerase [Phaeobacter sp. PT47_59]MDE4174316.1 epimerase [Phaeobacter sp. PT47_59]
MPRNVLVLGATGRFGRAAFRAFEAAGDTVLPFDRGRDDLMRAAMGKDIIVVGWNPAYPDWAAQVPGLHARVIAASKASGATVIVPGNVYVFGPQTPGPWSARSPHRAENPLGRIRIAMEEAYRTSGVRTILLRAGDFLDTEASGNWFDAVMTAKLTKGRFVYPGNPDIPHAWAYLPDMARAAVGLADLGDRLPVFADIPFPGYTLSGRDLLASVNGCLEQPVVMKQMAWWPVQLARPFWPMGRCLLEMRYLWNTAHSLDGSLFEGLLPGFEHTELSEALHQALPKDLLR